MPGTECRRRPLARSAALLGPLVFSRSPADRRWSRKDGEAARQGRAPHKDEPVRADPRDAGSHALHGQGAEPGRRRLRRSGWARAPGWEVRLHAAAPALRSAAAGRPRRPWTGMLTHACANAGPQAASGRAYLGSGYTRISHYHSCSCSCSCSFSISSSSSSTAAAAQQQPR